MRKADDSAYEAAQRIRAALEEELNPDWEDVWELVWYVTGEG